MDDFSALRAKMVDSQLKTEGVTDPAVLAAFAVVPRERFVPPRLKPLAYVDNDLLLKPADGVGPGRYLMEPAPLGRLVQAAEINPTDTVLVIGAGTGYSTAVSARPQRIRTPARPIRYGSEISSGRSRMPTPQASPTQPGSRYAG